MKLLIVAATRPEIEFLYEQFNLPKVDFVRTDEFDVLITGVGMTATAFALGQHLNTSYNLVLNLGIAGSFDRTIPLGSVLNIISDEFAELGAEDKDAFLTLDALGFGQTKYTAHHNLLNDYIKRLKKVNGITVNCVHGNEGSIRSIIQRLAPVTESMEGAAVLYACTKISIPCVQVRSISNYVEPRNRENWQIGLAIKNLNTWAIGFLTNT
ncbi:futalosine hydrolase [Pedobacter metabolipauper]|uniref:Futalosine hydrolase n=1 Tax=Pedobacter metabolipauper TaxID=425513 RepID=A0A4R6SX46_9SPHI|nr:futalosine hydrolase [Pedobacter metabolipauper]TDQ09733.1 futalosine hydrolase [Pedobacter metabolipauper]